MEIFHIKHMTENEIYLRETAILVARCGIRVFPCHSFQNGKCSCEDTKCKNPGKHPRVMAGISGATIDEELVKAWWSPYLYWGNSGVGIIGRTNPLEYVIISSKGEAEIFTNI